MTAPEFSRPRRLEMIGEAETSVAVEADAAERSALAARFAIRSVDRLTANFMLCRDPIGILATGHLSAAVTQSCSVTGAPVQATIDEDFAIRFCPEPGDNPIDEIELATEDCDTVFYSGTSIDLGEAAAETLALAIDPFPRSPAAGDVSRQIVSENQDATGPFAALASLKDKLGR